jgi:hypothetical protein
MIVKRMKNFEIPFLEVEMTIFVIHNCQRDETIPKPRQESEMSVELEVLAIGPLSLISTRAEG